MNPTLPFSLSFCSIFLGRRISSIIMTVCSPPQILSSATIEWICKSLFYQQVRFPQESQFSKLVPRHQSMGLIKTVVILTWSILNSQKASYRPILVRHLESCFFQFIANLFLGIPQCLWLWYDLAPTPPISTTPTSSWSVERAPCCRSWGQAPAWCPSCAPRPPSGEQGCRRRQSPRRRKPWRAALPLLAAPGIGSPEGEFNLEDLLKIKNLPLLETTLNNLVELSPLEGPEERLDCIWGLFSSKTYLPMVGKRGWRRAMGNC